MCLEPCGPPKTLRYKDNAMTVDFVPLVEKTSSMMPRGIDESTAVAYIIKVSNE